MFTVTLPHTISRTAKQAAKAMTTSAERDGSRDGPLSQNWNQLGGKRTSGLVRTGTTSVQQQTTRWRVTTEPVFTVAVQDFVFNLP